MKMLKEQNEYVLKFHHNEIHKLWFILNDYLIDHKNNAEDDFYKAAEYFYDEFDKVAKITNKYEIK